MAIFKFLSNQSGLSVGEIRVWRVDFGGRWYKNSKIEILYEHLTRFLMKSSFYEEDFKEKMV